MNETSETKETKPQNGSGGKKSTVLTVIIIVLATLLVAAITFICVTLFGGTDTDSKGDDTSDTGETSETVLDEETRKLYDTVVMTLDGEDIPYEIYRYYYLSCKYSLDGGDDTFWETSAAAEAEEQLREDVLAELKYEASIKSLCKKYGLSLTEDEIAEVEEGISTTASLVELSYGVSMDTLLASYYMTTTSFTELRLFETLADKLYEYLLSDDAAVLDFSEDTVTAYSEKFYNVKHILVGYDDDLSEDDAKAKIEEIRNTLTAITDYDEMEAKFDELMKEYSNDYQTDADNFYYYTDGEMDEDFEAAASATEIGSLSEITKSQFGYHLILRLPLDLEYFTENVYGMYAYRDYVEAGMEDVTVSYTEFYEELTPTSAK